MKNLSFDFPLFVTLCLVGFLTYLFIWPFIFRPAVESVELTVEMCGSRTYVSDYFCMEMNESVRCNFLLSFKSVSDLPARCMKYVQWPTQNLLEAEI